MPRGTEEIQVKRVRVTNDRAENRDETFLNSNLEG
jgi:hypothetical protein